LGTTKKELILALIIALCVTLVVFLLSSRFINQKVEEKRIKMEQIVETLNERLESILLQQSTNLKLLTTTFTHDIDSQGMLKEADIAYYREIFAQGYHYFRDLQVLRAHEVKVNIPTGKTHIFTGPAKGRQGELILTGFHPIYAPHEARVWGYLKVDLSLKAILEEMQIGQLMTGLAYYLSSGGEVFYGDGQLVEGTSYTISYSSLYWTLFVKSTRALTLFAIVILRFILPLLIGVVSLFLSKNFLEFRRRAHVDDMTGIMNKSNFMKLLEGDLLQCYKSGDRVAIGIIDIDDFKDINDHWGHLDGDQVLKTLVNTIGQSIGRNDTLARFGGDEFAVIMRNLDGEEDYYSLAKKLFAAIETLEVSIGKKTINVKSSMGVAISGIDGLDAYTLLSRADSALYSAKSNGKNKLVFS